MRLYRSLWNTIYQGRILIMCKGHYVGYNIILYFDWLNFETNSRYNRNYMPLYQTDIISVLNSRLISTVYPCANQKIYLILNRKIVLLQKESFQLFHITNTLKRKKSPFFIFYSLIEIYQQKYKVKYKGMLFNEIINYF